MIFIHVELEACWNVTEWLFKCHNCIVNNIPKEHCPTIPLPIPPDYVHNLGRRSKMAIKGILPPPLKMILNTYYPLPSQPPRPSPQCDAPPRRPHVQQSPRQQQCSGTRAAAAEKTTLGRSAENVCTEGQNKGGIDPEPGELEPPSSDTGQLESPSAGTGFETPG